MCVCYYFFGDRCPYRSGRKHKNNSAFLKQRFAGAVGLQGHLHMYAPCHHLPPQEKSLSPSTRYPIYIFAIISSFYADHTIFALLAVYLNHKARPPVLAAQRCFTFLSSSRFASAACPLSGSDPGGNGKP